MSVEDEIRPPESDFLQGKVDPYRATRELERWLFAGGNEQEMGELFSRRQLPANLWEGAEVVMPMPYTYALDGEGNLIETKTDYGGPEVVQSNPAE